MLIGAARLLSTVFAGGSSIELLDLAHTESE
jgi:hypothetical protein